MGETELKSSLLSKSVVLKLGEVFFFFFFFGEVFKNRFPTPFYALFPLLIQNLLGWSPGGWRLCFPVSAVEKGSQDPGIQLTPNVRC